MKTSPVFRGFCCFLFLSITLFTSGCSTFHRQWREAGRRPTPTDEIIGRWEGTWLSQENGHHGKLRCVVTKVDGTHYEAAYRATYKTILHFGYTAKLNVEKKDDQYVFRGDADLGFLAGGVYTYEGHATPANFFSDYRCKYDHGTYEMSRPK